MDIGLLLYIGVQKTNAGVAHLVERNLAKVEVASSSLVTRSIGLTNKSCCFVIIPLKQKRTTNLVVRFCLIFFKKSIDKCIFICYYIWAFEKRMRV